VVSGVFVDRVCVRLVTIGALSICVALPAQAETSEVVSSSEQSILTQEVGERSLVIGQRSFVIGQSSLVSGHSSPGEFQNLITYDQGQMTNDSIPQLSELEQPATTVTDWIAQIEASLVQITGVRVEETETGFQVVLETAEGSLEVPETRSIGNALIADIPNATIVEEFSQAEPIEGIALVSVTSLPDNRVRVAITGTDAPPVAEVISETQGLAFAITLGDADTATEEDAIQVVVTGEQEEGFNPSDTSVGTRIDTLLRDIPASIQIIPQQVLEEQQVTTFNEALRNAPGVIQTAPGYYNQFANFTIRGFEAGANFLRNGLRSPAGVNSTGLASIERIEVLRGPASVLFGQGNPGGTINLVTRQPLDNSLYSVEGSIGSYDFYRGEIDLTGPLNDSRTVLYRLTASYENADGFVDFVERENLSLASILRFEFSENTTLTLDADFNRTDQGYAHGLPAVGTVLPNPNGEIPRDRNISEPVGEYGPEVFRVGYTFEHRFSEDWLLRNAFDFADYYNRIRRAYYSTGLDPDQRTVQRGFQNQDARDRTYDLTTDIVGNFSTGSIHHQLLFGIDLRRVDRYEFEFELEEGTPIDLFDPVYSRLDSSVIESGDSTSLTDSLGIYIQDQVTILDNLKLVLGGRFDLFEQTDRDLLNDTEEFQSGDAFNPRVGIVYQPIQPISLYASYSRSFTPSIGRSADGEQFAPGRGTQYEIGMKADITDSLSATVAVYDLTRSNVLTDDLSRPGFSIQTGEQNSRGVELNIAGEILPGWNVIGGYAYTNARITEDNTFEEGNYLNNVPENSFNLWTSYEIQDGALQGFGLGLGLFYVGERQGDLENSFTLPSYLRTDAAIFYNRGQFRAALNFRNLFDVEYFESAYDSLTVYPAELFTVQGTISWQF
jgi:iron complex outermembrane recepter protein